MVRIKNTLLKRLVMPFWKPVRARTLEPLETRIATLESEAKRQALTISSAMSKIDALGQDVGGIKRKVEAQNQQLECLPRELEAHSTRQLSSITDMWERIEFMRREMLLEVKYAGRTENFSPVNSKVVAHEKLAAARKSGLRLNLGCGHIPLTGYVNVDRRELPNVDIVAEAGDLPIERGTAQEIFSAHLLEHFPQEELRRRLLPYWYSLLISGGSFHAVVPDGEAMFGALAAGTYSFDDFREVLFGGQDYEGDFHFNLFTPESLSSLLTDAGFSNARVIEKGRRNGKCFEFEILAVKPERAFQDTDNDDFGAKARENHHE